MEKTLKKLIVPLLISFLAIGIISTAFVYASADDSQTSNVMQVERKLNINDTPQGVIIRSDVEQGNVENHFALLFNTAHGIVIYVAFSHENEVGNNESEAALHLRIAYIALTEFKDNNGNGGLDTNDTIIQTVSLQNLTYTQPSWKMITSQDGKPGYELASNATAHDGAFFGVVADIFQQYARVGNSLVPPTATKITTTIQHFPYKQTSGTKLALSVRATSAFRLEDETANSEQTIGVRSATANGFYSWTPNAMVDGQSVPVVSTTERVQHKWLINLSYPQGQRIVHDPLLGFSFGATPIVTRTLLIGMAVASVSIFGLLVYTGRRQLSRVFTLKPISQ